MSRCPEECGPRAETALSGSHRAPVPPDSRHRCAENAGSRNRAPDRSHAGCARTQSGKRAPATPISQPPPRNALCGVSGAHCTYNLVPMARSRAAVSLLRRERTMNGARSGSVIASIRHGPLGRAARSRRKQAASGGKSPNGQPSGDMIASGRDRVVQASRPRGALRWQDVRKHACASGMLAPLASRTVTVAEAGVPTVSRQFEHGSPMSGFQARSRKAPEGAAGRLEHFIRDGEAEPLRRVILLSSKGRHGHVQRPILGSISLSACQFGPHGGAANPAAGNSAPVAGTRSRQ